MMVINNFGYQIPFGVRSPLEQLSDLFGSQHYESSSQGIGLGGGGGDLRGAYQPRCRAIGARVDNVMVVGIEGKSL